MTAGPVRILIADDARDARALLRRTLQQRDPFEVVAEAVDGVDAVRQVETVRPDVVVLDVAMPRMDGIEAARQIRRQLPSTRIVMLSAFSSEHVGQRAIDAGADVYLEKGVGDDELLAAIELLCARPTPAATTAGPATEPSVQVQPAVLEPRLVRTRFEDLVAIVPDALAVLTAVRDASGSITGFRVDGLNRQAVAITGWKNGATLSRSSGGRSPGAAGQPSVDEVVSLLVEAVETPGSVVEVPLVAPAEVGAPESPVLPGIRVCGRGDTVIVSWVPAARQPGAGPETLESLLEAAVVASAEGIALLDRDGRVVLANAVADRLLGRTPLLGRGSPNHVILRADTLQFVTAADLPLSRVLAGEGFDDIELFLIGDPPGTGSYVKVSGRPVFDAAGRPAGAVITVHDDTARKRAEQALAAAHAELKRSNAELEQYAYVASHDLSQPLRGIEGFATLLDERYRGRLDAEADEWLHHIVASVERMRALINDLLTYSRVTTRARPLEPVDLDALTREVVALFEQQIAASGALVTVEPLPTVTADRGQLAQVMQNLLANALTYVAPGVTPRVRVSALPLPGAWQITVVDNGIGVAAKDRERAFAMFQRLVTADAYPGTGIGLAVARKVVERHGGSIWIEDNGGGGSRFCFTLPEPAVTPG